jgi:hypothetical protein
VVIDFDQSEAWPPVLIAYIRGIVIFEAPEFEDLTGCGRHFESLLPQ